MATLTVTAFYTRKAIKFGTIGLIAFVILKYSFGVASDLWRKFNPPPAPPPTVAFGKLPALVFPEQEESPKLSYQLETIQGGLPDLGEAGMVYFIPQPGPNLLALDRAKEKAKQMGFTSAPVSLSSSVYQWNNKAIPPTILEMDIITNNFTLRYAYEDDQNLLNQKNLPSNEQAATEAKSFLNSNKLLEEDLKTGRVEYAYLRFTPPKLIPSISLSEADFIRVNLFRADQDGLRILPPDPKNALISFLFSGSRERDKRIIEANYYYSPIERQTFATYPLKKSTQAWNELQAGGGFIANLGQNKTGSITIRRVYLAYYDSQTLQNFLQPVFVFEGDQEFYAYVPAVSPEWLEETLATGD
jgi:hypothetical protein